MLVDSEIYTVRSYDKNQIASELREFVASADFPCVGATTALRNTNWKSWSYPTSGVVVRTS